MKKGGCSPPAMSEATTSQDDAQLQLDPRPEFPNSHLASDKAASRAASNKIIANLFQLGNSIRHAE